MARKIKTGKEADKIVKQVKLKMKKEKRRDRRARAKQMIKKTSKFTDRLTPKGRDRRGETKRITRRAKGTSGILTAMGITKGKQTYKGAGRPRGTYKYGVPIAVYKQNLREKKAQYQRYQQQTATRMSVKGFTPEQIQQLQQRKALQELEQPQTRGQRVQQRVQQMQRPPINIVGHQKMRVPTNMHNKLVQPGPSVADEELDFRKWSSETSISPRTQRMLDQIRRIQNKGKRDNIEQQRRLRERNMVGRAMNMMKAHENMINTDMDMTGVHSENILMAPNTFKEIPGNQILDNHRGAYSLLHTKEAGNNLQF